MSDRQSKIQELVWRRNAKMHRKSIADSLKGHIDISEIEFLDNGESIKIGKLLREKVDSIREEPTHSFLDCLPILNVERWPKERVIYFHRFTFEAGAIKICTESLLPNAPFFQNILGPDFFFVDHSIRFGFYYEQNEYESSYRYWVE